MPRTSDRPMHVRVPIRLSTPSKYHAVRTTIDNIAFASKKEAARYAQLKLLLRAGASPACSSSHRSRSPSKAPYSATTAPTLRTSRPAPTSSRTPRASAPRSTAGSGNTCTRKPASSFARPERLDTDPCLAPIPADSRRAEIRECAKCPMFFDGGAGKGWPARPAKPPPNDAQPCVQDVADIAGRCRLNRPGTGR